MPGKKKTGLSFAGFLKTPAGSVLKNWEKEQIGKTSEEVFGYRALQLGVPEIDFLAQNRIANRICAAESAEDLQQAEFSGDAVLSDFAALPFESESADLIVMPHSLDFAENDERARLILEEAVRVLIPEGRLILTAFNPGSLWGVCSRAGKLHLAKPFLPDAVRPVPLFRIRSWLSQSGLDTDRGRFGAYQPACRTESAMKRFSWLNLAGDRWWPSCGGLVMLSAVKHMAGVRLAEGISVRLSQIGARAAQEVPGAAAGCSETYAEKN